MYIYMRYNSCDTLRILPMQIRISLEWVGYIREPLEISKDFLGFWIERYL